MRVKFTILLISAVALTWTAGCTGKWKSEGKVRAYEIPSDLCGVTIDREQYDSLFPAGEKATEEVILPPKNGESLCTIRVDGEKIFDIDTNRMSHGSGVQGAINDSGYRIRISESVALKKSPYEVRIWPGQAIAYIKCIHSDFGSTGIGITFSIYENAEGDHTDTLARIINPYIAGRLAQIDPAYCTTD